MVVYLVLINVIYCDNSEDLLKPNFVHVNPRAASTPFTDALLISNLGHEKRHQLEDRADSRLDKDGVEPIDVVQF